MSTLAQLEPSCCACGRAVPQVPQYCEADCGMQALADGAVPACGMAPLSTLSWVEGD